MYRVTGRWCQSVAVPRASTSITSLEPVRHRLEAAAWPELIYEPLAFYSAFADKETLWLAESYRFSADYKTLTVKTRPASHGATASRFRPRT